MEKRRRKEERKGGEGRSNGDNDDSNDDKDNVNGNNNDDDGKQSQGNLSSTFSWLLQQFWSLMSQHLNPALLRRKGWPQGDYQ